MVEKSKKKTETESTESPLLYWVVGIAAILLLFNQYQIFQLSTLLGSPIIPISIGSSPTKLTVRSNTDLSSVNLEEIKSTAQAVAALFPVDQAKDVETAMSIMIPQGTPAYGQQLGVSYDDPVGGLNKLSRQVYQQISKEVRENDPQTWQRYLNLATKPVGISCEYCCGVGPIGITADGKLKCGCQHNPAVNGLALWLMKNTDMSDAEVLQEVLRWKALWFPKNMVELAVKIGGGDASVLKELPGMVGGC